MRVLDEMDDISAWRSLASDDVNAAVHEGRGVENGALVLEFDLAGTAGYAAATRKLPTEAPDDFEISFWMRGESGRNNLEVKFVDASGDNVWWYRRANYDFTGEWRLVRIRKREIEFAWGPTSERTLRRFDSIEFVVTAGEAGGRGRLWFDRLAIKPLEPPPADARFIATASSAQERHPPAHAIDGKPQTSWRSQPGAQQLQIDMQHPKEFGGLEIDWTPDLHASAYGIELSMDGVEWRRVRTVETGNGGRDSHLLPESEARYIRITMPESALGYGVREVHVRDLQFGASPNAFIASLAQNAKRGCYPRAYMGEQTYWTIVGVDGGQHESMLSEDGALELRKGSFSLEPVMRVDGEWLSWADVDIDHSLADGYLPIPSVHWRRAGVSLDVTAYASGAPGAEVTHAVYRIENEMRAPQRITLALLVRPFQVNPPAQFLNVAAGVSPIEDLSFANGAAVVNGQARVFPRNGPHDFRAASFEAGPPCEWLREPMSAPEAVHDESGLASGALLYEFELPAGGAREVVLDLPLDGDRAPDAASLEHTASKWREKLNRVALSMPPEEQAVHDTLRTALAHVLINRDGPALQPGSRAYERSWIRDAAMTSEMLLRLGQQDVVEEFLRWYAPYQFSTGKIPCCVDRRGADPIPENDSQGEFLFLVHETYRYGRNMALLHDMWPAVRRTVEYMEKLRRSERIAKNQVGERKAFYGLMPASISHEGYAAKPMHSYWDNFWALAGYEAAVHIARTLGHEEHMRSYIAARDDFRADLYRSLDAAMKEHAIDYLPGAAELGDFDPTSTTIALSPLGEQQMLPPPALHATFERYWANFTERRESADWDVYTPYEWRNVAAFIRLGWRERAQELIAFFMNDRRPAEWNQWAEVVGREARRSRFIGDMPHGWVASDFGRSVLDMLAYERLADEALVLAPGAPARWVRQGFSVEGLWTPFGRLTYSLVVQGDRRVFNVESLDAPRGGVVIAWPEDAAPQEQSIERGQGRWIGTEMRITELPFTASFAR
ncbi:MAG TPA: discoidin domain-containing protein [Steroidobacter sp.]|nr:discoidin domain-containing protein [Steroidobacteraceae bacterium]HLS82130.1 discoidin domain-containing protein [Steroidobacter sp.]